MANEDETVWIVFNGEIFNFAELRHELEAAVTASAPAPIPSALSTSMRSMAREAVHGGSWGSFAFALWDLPRRRLYLAATTWASSRSLHLNAERLLFGFEIRPFWKTRRSSGKWTAMPSCDYLTYRYIRRRGRFSRNPKAPPGHWLLLGKRRCRDRALLGTAGSPTESHRKRPPPPRCARELEAILRKRSEASS